MYRAYFQSPRVAAEFLLSLRAMDGVTAGWFRASSGIKVEWWRSE